MDSEEFDEEAYDAMMRSLRDGHHKIRLMVEVGRYNLDGSTTVVDAHYSTVSQKSCEITENTLDMLFTELKRHLNRRKDKEIFLESKETI